MWRMSVVFPEPGVPTTRKRRPGGAFSSASLPRSLATVVADDAAVDLEAAPLLASEEREVPRSSLGVWRRRRGVGVGGLGVAAAHGASNSEGGE